MHFTGDRERYFLCLLIQSSERFRKFLGVSIAEKLKSEKHSDL